VIRSARLLWCVLVWWTNPDAASPAGRSFGVDLSPWGCPASRQAQSIGARCRATNTSRRRDGTPRRSSTACSDVVSVMIGPEGVRRRLDAWVGLQRGGETRWQLVTTRLVVSLVLYNKGSTHRGRDHGKSVGPARRVRWEGRPRDRADAGVFVALARCGRRGALPHGSRLVTMRLMIRSHGRLTGCCANRAAEPEKRTPLLQVFESTALPVDRSTTNVGENPSPAKTTVGTARRDIRMSRDFSSADATPDTCIPPRLRRCRDASGPDRVLRSLPRAGDATWRAPPTSVCPAP